MTDGGGEVHAELELLSEAEKELLERMLNDDDDYYRKTIAANIFHSNAMNVNQPNGFPNYPKMEPNPIPSNSNSNSPSPSTSFTQYPVILPMKSPAQTETPPPDSAESAKHLFYVNEEHRATERHNMQMLMLQEKFHQQKVEHERRLQLYDLCIARKTVNGLHPQPIDSDNEFHASEDEDVKNIII